jgi:hypothetical protein
MQEHMLIHPMKQELFVLISTQAGSMNLDFHPSPNILPLQPRVLPGLQDPSSTPAGTRAQCPGVLCPMIYVGPGVPFRAASSCLCQSETPGGCHGTYVGWQPGDQPKIRHSLLSFLSQFDHGLHTSFLKDLWQIFFCTATGGPHPECALALQMDRKCKCSQQLNEPLAGHHLQACSRHC